MDMTKESCRTFVQVLASTSPAPGGGGAAAMVGAIGTALGNMVASLTVGKQKYAGVQDRILPLKARCDVLQEELMNQVEADEIGFLPLAAAFRMQKEDPNRPRIIEEATAEACGAPLRIMELCGEAIECIAVFAQLGSRLAMADAGCGAIACKAALQAAALNVYANTHTMQDRDAAEQLNRRAGLLLDKYCPMADEIYASVLETFGR